MRFPQVVLIFCGICSIWKLYSVQWHLQCLVARGHRSERKFHDFGATTCQFAKLPKVSKGIQRRSPYFSHVYTICNVWKPEHFRLHGICSTQFFLLAVLLFTMFLRFLLLGCFLVFAPLIAMFNIIAIFILVLGVHCVLLFLSFLLFFLSFLLLLIRC